MSLADFEFSRLHNGEAIPYRSIASFDADAFHRGIVAAVNRGLRIASLFARSVGDADAVELVVVLADDTNNMLSIAKSPVAGDRFPAVTPDCPQAHLFEREIAEQFGVLPEGHPWLKPVRFAPPMRPGRDTGNASERSRAEIGVMDFYRVDGEEVHEVAVGPVHAGVIEPGHFRFQCHGEHVFHLEISLGYQHRGVEEALIGGPHKITHRQIETVAGDTTVAHSWAYCRNLEALSSTTAPARAQIVRAVALELERLANHTGDLGALAGDVGFLPTQSFCGRLRGDFLNLTALICGNRFGRNLVSPGGVRFDLENRHVAELLQRLEAAKTDVAEAVELLWNTPSVLGRFENTGTVSRDQCLQIGMVGPAARACDVNRDVRTDHPLGAYQFNVVPISTADHGDVNARAFVRRLEIRRSLRFLREQLHVLPDPEANAPVASLAPNRLAVSLVEGWRGEVCHVAITDDRGRFSRYKITDPSFHNWMGLALAMRGQQISDFPLCNKSFNLSYCGFDL